MFLTACTSSLQIDGVHIGVAADGATPLGNRVHGVDAFIGREVLHLTCDTTVGQMYLTYLNYTHR